MNEEQMEKMRENGDSVAQDIIDKTELHSAKKILSKHFGHEWDWDFDETGSHPSFSETTKNEMKVFGDALISGLETRIESLREMFTKFLS